MVPIGMQLLIASVHTSFNDITSVIGKIDRMQTDVIQLGHCQLLTRVQSGLYQPPVTRLVTQSS